MSTESAVKHTPGPWELEELASNDIVGGPEGELLATAYPMYHDGLSDSQFANARLIAAAPAMLEALEVARELMGQVTSIECEGKSGIYGTGMFAAKEMAEAAIKKAKGE